MAAAALVFVGYKIFVRPCNLITPDTKDQKTCKCLGKVVNLKYLLGSEDAFELPKTEYCVGVIKKRF